MILKRKSMSPARVLVVHNRYRLPGGEDAVVDAEVDLLKSRGHAVETCIRDNHELEGTQPFNAFVQTVWPRRSWSDILGLITAFRPDVIHAHNTFADMSSSIYWAATRAGVPVVQTLHDFRHRCGAFRDKVTRYVALTEFCRKKFIEGGLPDSRVAVKPNFADVAHPGGGPRRGGLYVGRLSSEKGIATLMGALDLLPGITLDVIGDGPESGRVAAHPRMNLLGWLSHEDIHARMRRASYLVMPSIWYENCPRALIDAFGNGLPIVASHRGSLLELVDHGCTGLLFQPGSVEDLAQHIGWAETHCAAMRVMGANARRKYEDEFTPDRNYERMMAIYEEAIAAVGTSGPAADARAAG